MSDKSILLRLEESGQPARRVDLRGTERAKDAAKRYAVLGEIARGGVGVVHHGRDNDLGRDVALKVLREEYLANPELVQRFVEEAQIGAQLQHPGIVPVYELGLNDDRRPFFAMKLVKGQTLAVRLAERTDPGEKRRNLLAIFREACRTVAYAHARGVIHRDLKPSNIMIGSFGEVQVVDWGFAKVLRSGGTADEKLAKQMKRMSTIINTVRSGEDGESSVAGSVMGTPAYMPPEQALGHVEELDARSDVFCLGGILCEVLTGEPPFASMQEATHCSLEGAHARLAACGADEKLVELCQRALAPLPKHRPANAQVIAEETAAYLAKAEGRAHRKALQAATARTRAEQQQRARRFARNLVAASLAAILLVGGTFFGIQHQRTERERRQAGAVNSAISEASRARAASDLAAAIAAAERAHDLGGDSKDLLAELRGEAKAKRAADERDALATTLIAAFDELEIKSFSREVDEQQIDHERQALLKKHRLALAGLPERFAGSPRARELAASLDDWAFDRRFSKALKADYKGLLDAARGLDPQGNELRKAIEADEAQEDQLAALADPKTVAQRSPLHIVIATYLLHRKKRHQQAEALGRAAQRRHPGDFRLNFVLANQLTNGDKPREALRYYAAAHGLRPGSVEVAHAAGITLTRTGEMQRAIAFFRATLKRHPQWAHGYAHLAELYRVTGAHEKGSKALQAGFAIGYDYKLNSEAALRAVHAGDLKRAISLIEETRRKRPGRAQPSLVRYYALAGRFKEAEEELERCKELVSGSARGWSAASHLHTAKGEFEQAVAAARRAIALDEDDGDAWTTLTEALLSSGDTKGALEAQRKAVDLHPRSAVGWDVLATVLITRGDTEGAIHAAKEASRIDPRFGWFPLAKVLLWQKRDHKQALEAVNEALKYGDGHSLWLFKGEILREKGDLKDSIEAYKKAAARSQTKEEAAGAWRHAAWVRIQMGRYDEAIEAANKAVELDKTGWGIKARALMGKQDYAAAVDLVNRQYDDPPKDPAQRWVNVARTMMHLKAPEQRIFAARRATELDEKNKSAWGQLASGLFWGKKDYPGAVEAVSRMLELGPEDGTGWYVKGSSLRELKRTDEAFFCFSRMAEVWKDPKDWLHKGRNVDPTYANLAWIAWWIGDFDKAMLSVEEAMRRGESANTHYLHGVFLSAYRRHREAAAAFEECIGFGGQSGRGSEDTWYRLGVQYVRAGEFSKVIDRMRASPHKSERIQGIVERAELYMSLDPQLDRIVSGDLQPKDGTQAEDFALLCDHKQKYRAATRLFSDAVARGEDIFERTALAVAVLSGDFEQGLAWARKDLEWLRTRKSRQYRVRELETLKIDRELASVRDGKFVPEGWRAFWEEIDALIAKERAAPPEEQR